MRTRRTSTNSTTTAWARALVLDAVPHSFRRVVLSLCLLEHLQLVDPRRTSFSSTKLKTQQETCDVEMNTDSLGFINNRAKTAELSPQSTVDRAGGAPYSK